VAVSVAAPTGNPVHMAPRVVPLPASVVTVAVAEQLADEMGRRGEAHDGDADDGHRLEHDGHPLVLGVRSKLLGLLGELQQAGGLRIGRVHGGSTVA
jgi:hypothetical protein